jgi:ADP-ribose pyrophosphatase YjhB (NUDIX family)
MTTMMGSRRRGGGGRGTTSRHCCCSLYLVIFAPFLGVLVLYWLLTCFQSKNSQQLQLQQQQQQQQTYRGTQYWKEGVTQSVQTLYETPFARFQIHKVQLGDTASTIINDWLWYDESDNINVLVERAEDGKFLVLEQTKYGIDGSTYAVVGGLIETEIKQQQQQQQGEGGESPLQAAQRELQEELGMVATNWVELGAYRAAANRGGGTTYTFLARQAAAAAAADGNTNNNKNNNKKKAGATPTTHQQPQKNSKGRIAPGELERQDVIELSREELLEAVLAGKFKEIKWTATVALALLRTTTT